MSFSKLYSADALGAAALTVGRLRRVKVAARVAVRLEVGAEGFVPASTGSSSSATTSARTESRYGTYLVSRIFEVYVACEHDVTRSLERREVSDAGAVDADRKHVHRS